MGESKNSIERLFEDIRTENHGIHEAFNEALLLGQDEKVAKLADDYAQFMCKAGQTMLKCAKIPEEISLKYPQCKPELSKIAEDFRNLAQTYFKTYSSFEKLQRIGKLPTVLPDLSNLLK